MKASKNLDNRAAALVKQLADKLGGRNGMGSMSVAVYDTAWVAMVSRRVDCNTVWLFPQSFRYILDQQRDDGSWPSYTSTIDGILNTAASLLCLLKHRAKYSTYEAISLAEIERRIQLATLALQRLLDGWDVASTVHVGFEILVPSLLGYLQEEGIAFIFPQSEALQKINQEKLRKFRPEYLYAQAQLTALHSLEAFSGSVDFDRLGHHKVKGSFMASPSSTAAYLMNASDWDVECEEYLRQVVARGAGAGSGGVPSAWPSGTFETTWVISALLDGGIDLPSVAPDHSAQIVDFLQETLRAGNGVTGFAPGLGADADDTAKAILILNMLGKPTSPAALVEHFEDKDCFKTYPLERDPSFSANVNCLMALLQSPEPAEWTPQMLRIINFLCSRWENTRGELADKWNVSPYYSMMLLAQAFSRTLRCTGTNGSTQLKEPQLVKRLRNVLKSIVKSILQSANTDGSWGQQGLREETAYAAIALSSAYTSMWSPEHANEVRSTLQKSRQYLLEVPKSGINYLWVEKVTFGSELLSEAYVLAALNLTSNDKLGCLNGLYSDIRLSNGVSNGVVTPEQVNGQDAMIPTASSMNGVRSNGTANGLHGRTDSVMDGDATTTLPKNHCPEIDDDPWPKSSEEILLGPYNYLDKHPGKDVRGSFIMAFNTWLQVRPDRLAAIQRIVRMLHTSSLLVDDIEDSSELRRGIPVAHSIFGVPQTFNSANYVYFRALKEVRDLGNPEALDVFVEELINLHRGQGMDLYWRDSLVCPTEEEYLQMIGNKTGGLFRLAIRLMQAESGTSLDLTSLVSLLGLQFQICDDYLNLQSTVYTDKKGFCEDLTEGKFSFPVIHSIHADITNRELLGILKQKTKDVEIKKYAVEYMERTGSFEYTRRKVTELKTEALDLVARYEGEGWGDASAIRELVSRLDISK